MHAYQTERNEVMMLEGMCDWHIDYFSDSNGNRRTNVFKFGRHGGFLQLRTYIPFPVNSESHWTAFRIELHLEELLEFDVFSHTTFYKVSFICLKGGEHYINVGSIQRVSEPLLSTQIILKESFCNENFELLAEDTLIFRLQWSYVENRIYKILSEQATQTPTDLKPEKLFEKRSENFGVLYESQIDTDFVIRVGDKQFAVHRSILSARSEVFEAMFRDDTMGNRSGIMEIPDHEAATVGNVLHYIYSGEIRGLTPNTAVKMSYLSDKYELKDMKKLCLEFLERNITMENVGDAAALANVYIGEVSLKNTVIQFIKANYKELMDNTAWQLFSKIQPVVATEYLDYSLIVPNDHEMEMDFNLIYKKQM